MGHRVTALALLGLFGTLTLARDTNACCHRGNRTYTYSGAGGCYGGYGGCYGGYGGGCYGGHVMPVSYAAPTYSAPAAYGTPQAGYAPAAPAPAPAPPSKQAPAPPSKQMPPTPSKTYPAAQR